MRLGRSASEGPSLGGERLRKNFAGVEDAVGVEGGLDAAHEGGLGRRERRGEVGALGKADAVLAAHLAAEFARLRIKILEDGGEGPLPDVLVEGDASLGAYRFRLRSGTVEAALADVVVPATQNPAPHSNLFKEGEGAVTLRGRQEYTGTTYVDAGTLSLDGVLAASSVLVRGGRLEGGSELGRSLVAQGGVVALAEGTTLGRHLCLGEGSVFHATLGAASARTPALVASNAAARIVLDGATLDFSLADGGGVSLYDGVTLVDNRGTLPVEGAFAGFPEGEPVKLSSGRTVYVTYCGGDGNDVVLAGCHNETVFLIL